jgi:mRNA interferase HigB
MRWLLRVISKRALTEFWESREADSKQAQRDLEAWLHSAKRGGWNNFAGLKQTFSSADQVGNYVVFDVGTNRYRLIGRVMYQAHIVYVLRVMDHAEYDKADWADDCGCYRPTPKPAKPAVQKRKRG